MQDVQTLSFEAAYAELAAIVERLDAAELTLEESVALFERGRALAARCQSLLDEAELRVGRLEDDGTVTPLG